MRRRKLFFILLILFSTVSFIKLLVITTKISPSENRRPPPAHPNSFRSWNSRSARASGGDLSLDSTDSTASTPSEDPLTPKEYGFLQDLISKKAPCSILFFGLNPQHLELAELNRGGTTVFLQDEYTTARTGALEHEGLRIYSVDYHHKASEAYELLRHSRAHPDCRPQARPVHQSPCRLALTQLPRAVLEVEWDVVVVDGPSSSGQEAAGRMEAIYTAALIARAKNSTDVVVHNVDRTIERWYSWEFLCEENLASSKGRLWHFRISGRRASATFCSQAAVKVQ